MIYDMPFLLQSALKSVWKRISEEPKFSQLLKKFGVLNECLFESDFKDDYGSVTSLQEEFFFAAFHPQDHFTIEVGKYLHTLQLPYLFKYFRPFSTSFLVCRQCLRMNT